MKASAQLRVGPVMARLEAGWAAEDLRVEGALEERVAARERQKRVLDGEERHWGQVPGPLMQEFWGPVLGVGLLVVVGVEGEMLAAASAQKQGVPS